MNARRRYGAKARRAAKRREDQRRAMRIQLLKEQGLVWSRAA